LHRAFDVTRDPLLVLQQAIDLGIERILTSGRQKKAIEGIGFIENLLKIADNKIEIMPGSGLDPTNVRQFMKIGIQNFHMSLGKEMKSKMKYINPRVSMGKNTDDYTIKTADLSKITEVRNILDNNTQLISN
jgi:copper homeostasis protein